MQATSPSVALAALAERYWRMLCREFPTTAIAAGEATDDDILFRESPADYDRRDAETRTRLAELDNLDAEGLSTQDRATLRLLRHELDAARRLYEVDAHLRPVLFPAGPAYLTTAVANATTPADTASAERYVARLATLPAYVIAMQDALRLGHARGFRYPRVVLAHAIGSLRALATDEGSRVWLGPFERSAAAASEALRREAGRARDVVHTELRPAFAALAAFLEGPLSDGARDTVACTDAPAGRDFYRVLVQHFTTSSRTPDEIHDLGHAEVARLEGELAAVAAEAGYAGDLPRYRQWLASDARVETSAEALRERVEALCKRIDGRIPEFFGRIPRITYGVASMPAAVAERMPPAYAQPNPADRTAPGVYWVTSLPARYPPHLLVPITLHEAWPGHLMHIALMQEADGLPAFRRHGALRHLVCLEGWALYCEQLGMNMGLYRTPHQHYGRLESELWRAVRLVVDTGIHWYNWTRAQAIEYMASRLALPLATIEAEVDRYIGWPGQALMYQLGNLEFRALRERAARRLGDRFDLRRFHDAVMAAGALTLPVLRDVMDAWVDEQAGHAAGEETASGHA